MNFEQFSSTRKFFADVQPALAYDLGAGGPLPGFLYKQKMTDAFYTFYILCAHGSYVVEWGGESFDMANLRAAERHLYACVVAEFGGL